MKFTKYETKDFNCQIEVWRIYGPYPFSDSFSLSELSNITKISLVALTNTIHECLRQGIRYMPCTNKYLRN